MNTNQRNMKKQLIYMAVGLVCATGLTSCELDEYNPSAGASTIESFSTWKGLQAKCYSTLYHELYSKSDFLFLSECGTDLWLNPAGTEYSKETFYYTGLGVERGEPRKTWQQAYSVIATCNSVIQEAGNVKNGDANTIRVLSAEAKCIRAFMHLTLATYFGPIPLCTSMVGEMDKAPVRNSLAEVYQSIVNDLKEAAADLDVQPFEGNYARVTKKTALGLLARAYAQGAGEDLSEDGKSYWQRAKEVAEDLIANSSAYGMYLYPDVSDLWACANNRNNKEALFTAAGLDATGVDAGMAGSYFNATCYLYGYTRTDPNCLQDIYSTQKSLNILLGSHSQGGVMAPTKHAIDVYGDWDKRYENTFLTAFGAFTEEGVSTVLRKRIKLTSSMCSRYGINKAYVDQYINPYAHLKRVSQPGGEQIVAVGVYKKGDPNTILPTKNPLVVDMPLDKDDDRFSIYLSKNDLTYVDPITDGDDDDDEEPTIPTDGKDGKDRRAYFCMNISDLFDADGNYSEALYRATPSSGAIKANQLFPCLIKYNWVFDGATRHLGSDSYDFRNGDIYIMRAAEVYLIAAEANVMLGNAAGAKQYLKPLRDRACRTGYTVPAITDPTEQEILDEYARELCGEHMRWAVLKRHRASGLFKQALNNYNKKAAAGFNEDIHYCRPIPKLFLDQISNAAEFGDNGYGYIGNKGY